MRYSRAEEREDLDQIIDRPDDHLVYDPAAYTARGRILVTRNHRSVGLHRHLYSIVRGIPATQEHWFVIRRCDTDGCLNPWHHELHPSSHGADPAPRLGPARPTHADRMKARTHCPHGHPYTAENTYLHVQKDGYAHRACKTCRRNRAAERRNKRP